MASPTTTRDPLRTAEDELALLRIRIALVVAFIHNPAHDRDARTALAHALGLPAPAPERTPHHG